MPQLTPDQALVILNVIDLPWVNAERRLKTIAVPAHQEKRIDQMRCQLRHAPAATARADAAAPITHGHWM